MGKRIHHIGMTLTEKEIERWHKEAPELTSRQHDALMKKLGVTPKQDKEWHRTHKTAAEQRSAGTRSVNPFAVGGGFLAWYVKQGWLTQRGRQYFADEAGRREQRDRFGIEA